MSALTLAVDPGASSGWAIFDGRLLVRAGCARPCVRFTDPFDVLAIEIPQCYPGDPTPVQDLIALAIVAGRWIGMHDSAKLVRYYPREWKGQLPKKVGNDRTLGELTEAEIATIAFPRDAKGRTDVLDAIGIGLVTVGRLRRGLV